MRGTGQLVEIPFRSYHRLRQWKNEQELGSHFQQHLTDVWYEVMDTHFQKVLPQIRLYYDAKESGTRCVDISMEGSIEGQPFPLYLMTLVTGEFAAQEKFAPETLECLENPFQETMIWHCEGFGPAEILEAVRAWSQHFWPDFECEYVLEPEEEELVSESPSSCRVLLTGKQEMLGRLWSWLIKHGCEEIYCSPNNEVLLLDFPVAYLSHLRADFEGLPFEASFEPS